MIPDIYSTPDPQNVATGDDNIVTALRFDGDVVYEVTQNFKTLSHDLKSYTIDQMINDFIN